MRRVLAFGLVGFVLASASGCGGADSLMKELISGLNDMAASIEKKEPPEKQQAIADRIKKTSEKLDKLKLSDDEKKKLVEKYKPQLEEAFGRLMKASMAAAAGGAGGPNLGDLFGGFK